MLTLVPWTWTFNLWPQSFQSYSSQLITSHHYLAIRPLQINQIRRTSPRPESGGTCTKALSVFRKALASPSKVQTWELMC